MQVTGLTLSEYCKVRKFHCINNKKVAVNVTLEEGIVTLKHVFTTISPSITYHTINAKRCLLQMPLVAICLQYSKELYLMEKP